MTLHPPSAEDDRSVHCLKLHSSSDKIIRNNRTNQYLLSFSENPVFKAPGDGGRGVAGGLAGQGDFVVKL